MFKLTAVICFLSMGVNNLDLCMKGELPMTYPNYGECFKAGEEIIDYMNPDLITRNIALTLTCEKSKYQNATYIRLPI
jgi:hypothetical protein